MTAGPPDPSLPDRRREEIRDEINQFLADPLGFPPELTNWLSAFVILNALTDTPHPTTAASAAPIR